ncbi:MAG: TolC family protein [Ignavibacteriae bacterium]|nr:TolC family protein [Ignavibacteriota bacterium]
MNIAFNSTTARFIFVALVCATSLSIGQTPINPDSALHAILEKLEGTPLTLQQATQYALTNATSVRRAEAAYLAAQGSLRNERGLYDPELFFRLDYQDQQLAAASFFAGASVLTTQQVGSRTGIRMSLPIGTELELGINTTRLETNSQFAFLNPEYNAFGSLSLRQPLLGGFAASARKQLTRAEHEHDAWKARYDQRVIAASAEVERMYWDLYAAERDFAVQKLTRDRAEVFLKEVELRAQTGLVGPNQVANAKTFLAEQELLLLERDEQLGNLSDQLASLIGVRPGSGEQRFLPVDEPPSDFPLEPIDELVERALRMNLDLQASKRDVEAARALADAAGWEALPSVDLVGTLGGSGLTGRAREVIFGSDTLRTTRGGSLSDALSQVAKREFPNWSVGVEVSIPLGLRRGLGESDRLDAQALGAEQYYVELSRVLEEQVRATYRELSNGKNRLRAAREGVEAAQEQARIGLIEFYNGRTTAFELVRLGEDFGVAHRRYSAALVRTAKAAATLRQLTSGEYTVTKNN